jgi:Dolichyl-phosphate-mannose-protein mannosyltransferase
MAKLALPWRRLIALGVGLSCMLAYAAWQCSEPHGAFEFAYTPFTPTPLPYSAMRGFTYEQLWGHVRRIALLGPGLTLFSWGLLGYLRLRAPRDLGRLTKLACATCLVVTAVLMLLVLRGRALIDDELAYAMQASFFGSGHVAGPDLGVNPSDNFTIPTRLGYSIKYLPGEPLLQIPGVWLGVPALLHLPVVLVTLWAWHEALRRSSGVEIARWGSICLACSPMVMFTSASGLSHASCLMWVVLMGLGLEWGRSDRPVAGAALCGISFGFGLLTRPQSMVPIGAVLGLVLLFQLLRRRAYLSCLVLGLTAGAGALFVLFYDRLLSGSAFKLPWFLQCGAEHYGFGRVWATSSFEHGFVRGLENLAVVALRLNSWLLGLPLSLGVVVLWVAWGRKRAGAGVWLVVGLAVLAFEFLYYSPGASDTGAIYHYELVLPFSVMAAVVLKRAFERFPSAAPLVVVCALALGTGSWLLEQGLRVERLVSTIHRQSDLALSRIEPPALLIYERRESEIVRHGWLLEAFPRRFRSQSSAIVSLPRVTTDMPARAARVYPGRQCWYFHYRPATNQPELLRCEDAAAWLTRPPIDLDADAPTPFVERSTAYLKTDYNPAAAIAAQRVLGANGQRRPLCCQVRGLGQIGIKAGAELLGADQCLETGEPP